MLEQVQYGYKEAINRTSLKCPHNCIAALKRASKTTQTHRFDLTELKECTFDILSYLEFFNDTENSVG